MGPTRVQLAPDGTHVGPMNLAIRELITIPRFIPIQYENGLFQQ